MEGITRAGRTGAAPVGAVTRGTTAPNRLRRVDRWLAGPQAWRLRQAGGPPLVVDLGYGASPVTTVELLTRLRAVRADVEVVGLEIDPARVAAARPLEQDGLRFVRGGFELPLGGRRPTVVRAFNVLRQYAEGDVAGTWARLGQALGPGGVVVDGTCDEVGRRACWVAVEAGGPVSLTVSTRLAGLSRPSAVAERLPKALIHRNVPGEPVHAFLTAWDRAWERQVAHAGFGARQRFLAAAAALRDDGWALLDGPSRWRLGEVTVAWSAVRPDAAAPAAPATRGAQPRG